MVTANDIIQAMRANKTNQYVNNKASYERLTFAAMTCLLTGT